MDSRPEKAFRVADRRHPLFDGMGAFRNGARWNSPGRRVIYASRTYEGALLEVLVHTRIGRIPPTHSFIEIAVAHQVSIEFLFPEGLRGWSAPDSADARAFGDAWHDSRRSLVLVVPSVVTRGLSQNLLINQDHPEFGLLRASEPSDVLWDSRLFEQ